MIFEKKYIWISIAVSCSLLIASCSNDEPQTAGEAPLRKIELEAFQLDYLQATNKFADNLWSQLNQSEPKTVNFVFFSPVSTNELITAGKCSRWRVPAGIDKCFIA